jgi:preprotein translocase subunit SecG
MMGSTVFNLVLLVHVLAGLGVIGLVLVQHGKGADMGAAFGSGASGSLFGASGSANFLSRSTAVLATVFFITTIGLSYLAGQPSKAPDSGGIVNIPAPVQTAPASAPAEAAPGEATPGKRSAQDDIPE